MKSVKLSATIYATPTGLKVGSRGKVQPPKAVLHALPKGERRKVRKAARSAGLYHVACA